MTNTNTTASTHSGGIGLTGALFLVFLVLKLTGFIDWSWWWVTAPLWIPALVVIGILVLIGVGVGIKMGIESLAVKNDRKRAEKSREAYNEIKSRYADLPDTMENRLALRVELQAAHEKYNK